MESELANVYTYTIHTKIGEKYVGVKSWVYISGNLQKTWMEQLRTQVEEVYADDEEMIEFIEKRNKRTAKEKAREKALAKIREAESEEKTKKWF